MVARIANVIRAVRFHFNSELTEISVSVVDFDLNGHFS
jgi:hypothetical protein